jgi:hypothetical protein
MGLLPRQAHCHTPSVEPEPLHGQSDKGGGVGQRSGNRPCRPQRLQWLTKSESWARDWTALRLPTSPSSPPQPTLSLGFDRLVVGQGVATQERTQLLRMGRLPKPGQGFDVQLAGPFRADTQHGPDPGIEGPGPPRQSIASQKDDSQSLWQPGDEVPKGRANDGCLPHVGRIRRFQRGRGGFVKGEMLRRPRKGALGHLDLSPHMVHNTGPCVGGEGRPPLGVKAQNGAPHVNATRLRASANARSPKTCRRTTARTKLSCLAISRARLSRQPACAWRKRAAPVGTPGPSVARFLRFTGHLHL